METVIRNGNKIIAFDNKIQDLHYMELSMIKFLFNWKK